jgi:hypothetical protein
LALYGDLDQPLNLTSRIESTYNLSKSKYSTSSANFCNNDMGSLKDTSKAIVDMSCKKG